VIAVLLVIIAAVLLFAHDTEAGAPALTGGVQFGSEYGICGRRRGIAAWRDETNF
jgi:hypothetical protein